MQSEGTIEQVRSLLSEIFQIPAEDVHPELSFGDIPQWDSIGHMDVMMRLEDFYHIEITAETIGELTSISSICSYLEKHN
jgi:acyl carrier protein